MRVSQNEPAKSLTGHESVPWALESKSIEQGTFTPKSESELLAARASAGPPEPDVPADRIEHVTHPDVSAAPASGAPFHTFRSSFSGPSVAISIMLALIFGIGVGAVWAWKSPSSVATPEQISPSAFARQLNFIAQDLSSLRQDLKGLAAHQEQLATAQASLMAAQEQTLLKLGTVEPLKHGSPTRRAYR